MAPNVKIDIWGLPFVLCLWEDNVNDRGLMMWRRPCAKKQNVFRFNKYRMFESCALEFSYLIWINFWVIFMANSLFKFRVYIRYSWKTYRCQAGKEVTILHGTRIFIIVVTKAPTLAQNLSQPNLITQIIPYLIRANFKRYLGVNLWTWILNNKSLRTALFWDFTKRRMVISHPRFPTTYTSHIQR